MSVITIIGAGMMGSAMSVPASDNGYEVRLVGTHLDRDIIEFIKKKHIHPKMNRILPDCVKPYQIEELETAIMGADLIIGGVSSFGVDWFAEKVLPLLPDMLPVLLVTKGLQDTPDGELISFPKLLASKLPGRKLPLNAIGGPCNSYELADRRHSAVTFCGDDPIILDKLRNMLETSYYHISLSTDVMGVECAVALKNAYALCVSLAIGLIEQQEGIGCNEAYNPQAAIFGQSVREMISLLKVFGGGEENIVLGAGDLFVTVFGGRTRKLGILLGRGLSFNEAIEELENVTLESVVIAARISKVLHKLEEAGKVSMNEFPLMSHLDAIINKSSKVDIPWQSFETKMF